MGVVALRTSSIGLGFVPLAAACLLGGCADTSGDLDSSDPVSRLEAVQQLAARGDAAVERLAQGAGHEDPMTARAAVRALGGIRSRSATDALARTARSEPRPAMRLEATIELGYRRDAEAAAALRRVLTQDAAPEVRGAAATALGRVGLPGDMAVLLDEAERATDARFQNRAVGAVGRILGVQFFFDSAAPLPQRLERLAAIRRTAERMVRWAEGAPDSGRVPR